MTKFIDLAKQLLQIVVKNPATLQLAQAVLDFLENNQHLIDLVLDWFSNLFSSPDGGPAASSVPEGLEAISGELVELKKVQLS